MGFFNIFKHQDIKKTEQIETKTNKPDIPENHISKKKKNTYIVNFCKNIDYKISDSNPTTPLTIIEINGKKQSSSTQIKFPAPSANEMIAGHEILCEVMGEKISATIIEYLDKATNRPVVQVYPEGWYVFDIYSTDFMSHLNHASRRDLKKQLKLREQKINDYITQNQNQH